MAKEPIKKAVKKTVKKVAAKKKVVKKVVKKGGVEETRGRNEVNPDDYNPDWKAQMLAAYGNGKSDVWVRCKCFGDRIVSNDLWYRWIEDITLFSETVKHGKQLSMLWWEDVSQDHATGANEAANATSLIFNMTNRFRDDWKQRQAVEQTTKVSLDLDEADKLSDFLKEHGVDVSTL